MKHSRNALSCVASGWALASLLAVGAPAQRAEYATQPDSADLSAHYQRAERELRLADVSQLDPEQRTKRSLALDWLREYRENADFGRNTLFPGERKLYFVDPGGRRCAVAWLLDASGECELVERIAATNNHAYVAELAGSAELQSWLAEYGLSVEDAARIQGPGGGPGDRFPPGAGGTWSGPGDTTPAPGRPGTPGPSGPNQPDPSGPSGPSGGPNTPRPGGPSAPQNPNSPANMPGPSTYAIGPEVWMTWWELHKMDYLRPNLLDNWHGAVTQWESDGSNPLDAVRAGVIPALLEALSAEDPRLRGSAAIALGRMAGERAIEPLFGRLADPDHEVRERAILALGATGTAKAAQALHEIATSGTLGERRNITHDARPLAVLGLAIGRRNGMSGYWDHALSNLLDEVSGTDRFLVQGSGLLYQTMNPGPALSDWSLARSTDENTALGVRCRATETLRTRSDEDSLAVLLHHLSGDSLELRRSAALALGEFEHSLALQPLLTAAEVEKEPLTRAFVLLSIGRQGGQPASAFLREFLEQGPKTSRSWCALALGILARDTDDAEARKAIREGLGREKNREYRGAYYLALGIARDAEARDLLVEALCKGSSYEIRAGAAMGLGMLEDPEGIEVLRERLPLDKCEYTRAAIAEAIGFVGDYDDCALLTGALEAMEIPENQERTALALGLHGQRRSVEALVEIAKDVEQPARKRAAAIDALQVVLGKEPSLAVGDMLRQSNFLVFPPTLVKIRRVLL